MKYIILIFALFWPLFSYAETQPIQVSAKNCKQGPQFQSSGPFAIYVFCDDALGTNIAVFLNNLGAPLRKKYDLGKRFWQGEPWSYDVTSFSWVGNGNKLLVATSAIYGSGSLYLLDLEAQKYKVLCQIDDAVLTINKVSNGEVILSYEIEPGKINLVKIAM